MTESVESFHLFIFDPDIFLVVRFAFILTCGRPLVCYCVGIYDRDEISIGPHLNVSLCGRCRRCT